MGQVVLLGRTVGRAAGKHRDPARRRRWITVSVAVVTVLVVLVAGAWLALERAVQDFDRGVERFASPFSGIPEVERPSRNPAVPEAIDLLLLGSESRVSVRDSGQWKAAARQTDAIMLVHVPQDRRGAYFLSIPRDSWVDIPGYGKGAIGDALGYGGPQLMVRAVERLTQQRIEHVAIVDFTGFRQVTDAVGGVTITVPAAERGRSGLAPGQQRMDGATALKYVRRGDGVRGGGVDQVRRQQSWIRAMLQAVQSRRILANPLALNRALQALSRSLAADEDLSLARMRSLASSLVGVGPGDAAFLIAPVRGTRTGANGELVVDLDHARAKALWTAMREDQMSDWVRRDRPS